MTFVVAGGSGNTGSVVAESLLKQGKAVRAIVRSREKGRSLQERGAELAEASLGDVPALTRALAGAAGAYLLLPTVMNSEHTLADQAKMVDAIASALQAAKVPHVVVLSSIGAHLEAGTGPIRSLAYAEQRLSKVSGTHFTFLRAAYFMENYGSSLGALSEGTFQTFIDPTRKFAQVATVDIGKLAARSLLEGTSSTEIIELAGPVDGTEADAARIFGEVLGKPLTLQVAPLAVMPDVLSGVGISRDLGLLYVEMTAALNDGTLQFEGGHRFERGTTPLRTVAEKLLAG
jgi:uncharacterized protein YbjT (DUF2867 family)